MQCSLAYVDVFEGQNVLKCYFYNNKYFSFSRSYKFKLINEHKHEYDYKHDYAPSEMQVSVESAD